MKQSTVGSNGPDPAVSAAPGDIIEDDWPAFLDRYMGELGWGNLDLARASGIDRSQVSRWRNGEGLPRNDKIRAVCSCLRLDIRYGIVAAGLFTAEEMKLRRPPVREALRAATPEELTGELLGRVHSAEGLLEAAEKQVEELRGRAQPSANGHGGAVGAFREQHRPVVSDPFTFVPQDGRPA